MTADPIAEIADALRSLGGVVDSGEAVDELAHALQCAGLAIAAGAGDELVAAALLHDVARAPAVAATAPGEPHERVGARWLAPRLGETVAWLVGQHVAAKRHLAATDPAYAAGLSEASRRSLARQDGPGAEPLPVRDPRWPDALRLRRFDDAAKVVGAATPALADVLAVLARLTAGRPHPDS